MLKMYCGIQECLCCPKLAESYSSGYELRVLQYKMTIHVTDVSHREGLTGLVFFFTPLIAESIPLLPPFGMHTTDVSPVATAVRH